ncbi:hypothetical protein I7I53_09704 [Histoplasma capsulatum var. duboisii H88]|uniref:Uncharacterized protein n=1 Tax=Ajellomyces capsulatus (strain H88) TaxID=544711 RepID=A0A8A1L5Z8_AJEC8|nr:hypothetical protein I7I53_09704 [Histoplasma capsulatum var. duboisii H88]
MKTTSWVFNVFLPKSKSPHNHTKRVGLRSTLQVSPGRRRNTMSTTIILAGLFGERPCQHINLTSSRISSTMSLNGMFANKWESYVLGNGLPHSSNI